MFIDDNDIRRCTAILSAIAVASLVSGCGSDRPVVTVRGQWPDGTGITLIRDGAVDGSTRLYGGRARVEVPAPGGYCLVAAAPGFLTRISGPMTAGDPDATWNIPLPVPRRTIAGGAVGFAFTGDAPDSLYTFLCREAPSALTAVSPAIADSTLTAIVAAAHGAGVAVIPCFTVRGPDDPKPAGIVSAVAAAAADGAVLEPDETSAHAPWFTAYIRTVSGMLHERGFTMDVRIPFACSSEPPSVHEPIAAVFERIVPESEWPDVVRLAFVCGGIPATAAATRIAEVLRAVAASRIPSGRCAVELRFTGFVLRGDAQERPPDQAGPGIVERLRKVAAPSMGGIHMRDGSVRLGFGGSVYMYDNLVGTAVKMGDLASLGLPHTAGVYLVFDGCGVLPDADDASRFASSLDAGGILESP